MSTQGRARVLGRVMTYNGTTAWPRQLGGNGRDIIAYEEDLPGAIRAAQFAFLERAVHLEQQNIDVLRTVLDTNRRILAALPDVREALDQATKALKRLADAKAAPRRLVVVRNLEGRVAEIRDLPMK
jgi:hypothetical protein